MIEQWKNVDSVYQVSNLGRLKCLEKIIIDFPDPSLDSNYVSLPFGGRLHRLVAKAFLNQPSEHHNEVNHKNFMKNDNRAENLEWVTHAENMRHLFESGRHTLPNNRKVVTQYDLDGDLVNIFKSIGEAAEYIGCHRRNLSNQCDYGRPFMGYIWTKEIINQEVGRLCSTSFILSNFVTIL